MLGVLAEPRDAELTTLDAGRDRFRFFTTRPTPPATRFGDEQVLDGSCIVVEEIVPFCSSAPASLLVGVFVVRRLPPVSSS